MPSSTSATMLCLFTEFKKPLQEPSLDFYHIDGNENPADILSKHWGYQQIWKLLQPFIFWRGDTKDIDVLDLYKAHPGSVVDF